MPDFLLQTFAIIKGNVIPALIVLTAVVFVHEMGHFLVARWCGIRVAAFSIGFGRELTGFTDRRGTRWKLSAIPLGGYVRFEGDDNAASIPDAEMLAKIPLSERRGLFHFAPLWKRVAVVAAGPIANFILAIVVFAAVFAIVGRPHVLPRAETVMPNSAAERAGIKPGDLIVSVDGTRIDSFSKLQSIVMLSADDALTIEVDRNGERVTLQATPGAPGAAGPAGRDASHRRARHHRRRDRFPPRRSAHRAQPGRRRDRAYHRADDDLHRPAASAAAREREQLSGVIRIGQVSGAVASNGGLPGLIYLTAVLSVSIGLFNLFPVPMLDGGHLLFYAIEALQGTPAQPAPPGPRLPHRFRAGDHAVHLRDLQRHRQFARHFRQILTTAPRRCPKATFRRKKRGGVMGVRLKAPGKPAIACWGIQTGWAPAGSS